MSRSAEETSKFSPENHRLDALALDWFIRRQQGQEISLLTLCQGDVELAAALAAKLQRFQQETANAIANAGIATTPLPNPSQVPLNSGSSTSTTPTENLSELTPVEVDAIAGNTVTWLEPPAPAPIVNTNVDAKAALAADPQFSETVTVSWNQLPSNQTQPSQTVNGISHLLLESGLVSERDLTHAVAIDDCPVQLDTILLEAGADQVPPLQSNDQTLLSALIHMERITPSQILLLLEQRLPRLVLGNYEILEPIGAGGMGRVYKARHRRMKRDVALKVLPSEAMNTPAAVERFRREVEAAAKLQHPNIVTAFDADEADGLHFLVMEYVAGQDLHLWVHRKGPMTVSQAIHVLVQTARALEYAHQQGIIHRDIKPSNLLVTASGTVKMLDLGLVRQTTGTGHLKEKTLTEMGVFMGTVDFMAPEQAADASKADHRADLYSLGCTLHFLLTGKSVVAGETIVERLMAHQLNPTPDLCQLRPEVPEELNQIFQRLLAKKPAERYQSASELLRDIRDTDLLTLAKQGSSSGTYSKKMESAPPGNPTPAATTPTNEDAPTPPLRKSSKIKTSRHLPQHPTTPEALPEPPPGTPSPEALFAETVKNFQQAASATQTDSIQPSTNNPKTGLVVAQRSQLPIPARNQSQLLPFTPTLILMVGLAMVATFLLGIVTVRQMMYLTATKGGTIILDGNPEQLSQVKFELRMTEPKDKVIPVEWYANKPIIIPHGKGSLHILHNGKAIWGRNFNTSAQTDNYWKVDLTYVLKRSQQKLKPALENETLPLSTVEKTVPMDTDSSSSTMLEDTATDENQPIDVESDELPMADWDEWDEIWLHVNQGVVQDQLKFVVDYHTPKLRNKKIRWSPGEPLRVARGSTGILEIIYQKEKIEKVAFDFAGPKKYLQCNIYAAPEATSTLYIESAYSSP